MSYDLMVFEQHAAPKTRKAFMDWYDTQVEWSEDHDYMDPKVTSKNLNNWFLDMKDSFPALNGPYAIEDFEESTLTDYCIGKHVIYATFRWSVADNAHEAVKEKATENEVGFYDASGHGEIYFPDGNGGLVEIDSGKPWWKFW